MKKLTILILITLISAISVRAQSYWQQQINYTIDVTLNDAERSLDGFIKIQYNNHSPDTLKFIWIHCWPNAYKNDRTAFSEQLLGNGRTDFYFSDRQQRGYINRLDFRVDDQEARMEDHPQYIDIIKVILPHPLPPEEQVTLSTPFHVKLPYDFSRSGYSNNTYNITQWYPKPAVYDSKGWHPIPYLDQGEFYSEFASFDVRITAPQSFTIAATGELQNSPTLQEIAPPAPGPTKTPQSQPSPIKSSHPKPGGHHPIQHHPIAKKIPQRPAPVAQNIPTQNIPTKTVTYHQSNIHDFAFFASKHFTTLHDTLQLPSGRIIQVYSYYTPAASSAWQNSLSYIKDAIKFRSSLIGEYPYNVVTAVETKMGPGIGGMEYPTITAINNDVTEPKGLDITIEHEVGHNWFYGILGTNERRYAWMDEGINTYYDNRYTAFKYGTATPNSWLGKKLPADEQSWSLDILTTVKGDQPIDRKSVV